MQYCDADRRSSFAVISVVVDVGTDINVNAF